MISSYSLFSRINWHQFSSLDNIQPNYMSVGPIKKVTYAMACKRGFTYNFTSLGITIQLFRMNFRPAVIPIIIVFYHIGLDDILFLFLFLDQRSIFQWRNFFIKIVDIPFPPNIYKESFYFFLNSSGLCSGMVKGF